MPRTLPPFTEIFDFFRSTLKTLKVEITDYSNNFWALIRVLASRGMRCVGWASPSQKIVNLHFTPVVMRCKIPRAMKKSISIFFNTSRLVEFYSYSQDFTDLKKCGDLKKTCKN